MVLALVLLAGVQTPGASADTLHLAELQRAALARDARGEQRTLEAAASDLRRRNIATDALPTLGVGAEATYLSDVPSLPFPPGEGPVIPRDRYEAALSAEHTLYDGGERAARRRIEDVGLRESLAAVDVVLYPLVERVNEAYFAAALMERRAAEADLVAEQLSVRLAEVRARVAAGAALPGDAAVLEAELLRVGQSRDEAESRRRAALSVLRELTDREVADDAVLPLPDVAGLLAEAMARPLELAREHRPELRRFASARERIAEQAAGLGARQRPRAVAMARIGYGRPGLDQFSDEWDAFWTGGLRLEWRPWEWGRTRRERDVLRLQREIVTTEEAAFLDGLERALIDPAERLAQLSSALDVDERIVALREQVEAQARRQLEEGALMPSAYVDALTELRNARLALEARRIETAREAVRYLTILGVPLP